MPPRLLLPAALATILLSLPAAAGAAEYVPGEVIVKYRDAAPGPVETLQQVTGTDAEQTLAGGSQQLAIEDGDSVRETLTELRADPNVAYAVPNYVAHAAAFVPNDPDFALQWNLQGSFGIRMPDAWALAADMGAPGGRGAVVAVLDSGVAYETRGRHDRAGDEQPARHRRDRLRRPGDAAARARLAWGGRQRGHLARDPLCDSSRRGRDQPEPRVRPRGALDRHPRRALGPALRPPPGR